MKNIFLVALLLLGVNVNAQIVNDSTVHFFSHWNLNETQQYSVVNQKYNIHGNDTILKETIRFDSEISIIDSTNDGYTLKWTYKNFDCNTNDLLMKELMKVTENISVIYTTNKLGVFQEIKNFNEIHAALDRVIDSLAIEFQYIPNIGSILNQMQQTFVTKETIEKAGINEILYFHAPYGSQHNTNLTYSKNTQLPNLYGGKPVDAKVDSKITKIDKKSGSATLKIHTTIDSEQATDATYEYMKKLSMTANTPEPKKNVFPTLQNQTKFASSVHMPTGWIIHAENIVEVARGERTHIEKTEIKLK